MNVVFLTRRFWPEVGGVEKHVLYLSRELIKQGHQVTVVAEQTHKDYPETEIYEGIDIFRIPIEPISRPYNIAAGIDSRFPACRQAWRGNDKGKKWPIWRWLFTNRKLLVKADVIHCHDVFFWHLPFRLFYPMKKVYTTFHGWEGKYPPSSKAIRVRKLSNWLSTGSIAVGDFIEKWYGTKPAFVTYGGVVKSSITPKPYDKESYPILYLGRLAKDTGLETFLKVVKKLKSDKDFSFSFAGEGDMVTEVSKYGKCLGVLDYDSCIEQIAKHRLIFVSGYLTILEALSQKRAVVALYDNLLKKDYFELSPFLRLVTASGDANELYNRLVYLKNNPAEEHRLCEAGYQLAQQYSWENLAKHYLNLWSKWLA